MARTFVPKIVTANDLIEGDVVYFTSDHLWSRNFREARICFFAETANELLSIAENQQSQIVGPYLADVEADQNIPVALLHFREKFRTKGPSNYFHGKQAEHQQQGA